MAIEIDQGNLNSLLEYLKASRGFDFSGYKETTLARRIAKRMHVVGVRGYGEYIDYLQVHPLEFGQLFNTILINVTQFFRDPSAWEYLREKIIPAILANKAPSEYIRIWSAGCASGEEVCSITMLMAEALGPAFWDRVKIYATDVDEEALSQARAATYSAKDVEGVPAEFLEKYFELVGDKYVFDRDLRRSIIFGRHDLFQDAPISRVDLLSCRNTLMYFNAEIQERILARFQFALAAGGYLFLGKAETLLTHGGTFAPVDFGHRVFVAPNRAISRDGLLMMSRPGSEGLGDDADAASRLREAAIESAPMAQILLDAKGTIAAVNDEARKMFGLGRGDIGKPFQDLELSYRPVELRSVLEDSYAQRRPVTLKNMQWRAPDGRSGYMDVQVTPLVDRATMLIGAAFAFTDVSEFKRLQDELVHFNQELETAYEELQSTNEELQTTNEELQSTVEELETTNEELQSANEELVTMNEEIQSTNEELETINHQLEQTTGELEMSNSFLNSVLSSLHSAVVVVDPQLTVLAWNDRAADMWGLRVDEVRGQHFLNLDIGLPVHSLKQPIKSTLSSPERTEKLRLEAVNRRGRSVQVQVTFSPLLLSDGVAGAIMDMEEVREPPAGDGKLGRHEGKANKEPAT